MDTIEEIKKLKALLDKGAITTEEFNDLKKKIFYEKPLIPPTESNDTINSQSTSKRHPSLLKKILLISVFALITAMVVLGIKYHEPIRQKIMGNKKTNSKENTNFIYENGEKLGALKICRFTLTIHNNGIDLNIPDGKLWTPLYYEVESTSSNCYSVPIPRIFTERQTSIGWVRSSSYFFPEKKDFVSYRLARRNNKAFAGEKRIMCDDSYCDRVSYVFYFLVE
jgi:hypothetical protein